MQSILDEASSMVEKTANDAQGAPDTESKKENKQEDQLDAISAATNTLKLIQEFKSSLSASASSQQVPDDQAPSQNETQPTEPAPEPTVSGPGTIVQTPGGSIIKIAMAAYTNKLMGEK